MLKSQIGVGLSSSNGACPKPGQAQILAPTKVPVGAKNIKFGPKWVENRRFGPKQRPNESYGLSGPIRTTPEAKNGQKSDFSRKTAPGGPGGPRRPPSLLSAQAGAYVTFLEQCWS